jgi:hypothetical protein
MAAAVAAVPVPAVPDVSAVPISIDPQSDMATHYDPTGAMGGLFAPGFIRGYQPSEDAVMAWNAQNRGVTRADVDATRMPGDFTTSAARTPADGVYGSGVPQQQAYGGGAVDPLALRAWAQGGKYDASARRAAIAARLAGLG